MSPDLEHGFGTGLRAQLRLKQGDAAEPAPEVTAPPEPEQHEQAPATAEAEIGALRAELEEALNREQQLRDALQHHVEAHERELAAGRDLALQEAEVQQDTARLAERESDLDERERVVHDLHERVADERRELNLRRTELLGEEARIVELGLNNEGRTAEIDAASIGRENIAAELARQIAEHAERERALNITRAEAIAREEAVRVREEAAGARERDLLTAESEVERVRARLQERVTAIASRESDTDARLAARESGVADREASLGAWEERVRAQADRVERERTGHGRASEEAFTLLAELELREEAIKLRETDLNRRQTLREVEAPQIQARDQLLARGEAHLTSLRDELDRREELAAHASHELAEREASVGQIEHELRLREAKLDAELELRADKLERLAEEVAERERLLGEREQELAVYVGELQQQIA